MRPQLDRIQLQSIISNININTSTTSTTSSATTTIFWEEVFTSNCQINDKLNTIEYTTELINEGYSFEEIYLVLKKEILQNVDISNDDKGKIFMEMCRSYDKIINGASELININHVINIINKL
jgi:hypothetical protein